MLAVRDNRALPFALDTNLRTALLQVKKLQNLQVAVPGLKGEAAPHQNVGIAFMSVVQRGLLLDFVGAGKTFQTIGADLALRSHGLVGRTLVLCQSGKRFDWAREYQRFSPLTTNIVKGKALNKDNVAERELGWMSYDKFDVTVASYENFRLDMVKKTELPGGYKYVTGTDLLHKLKFDLVVLDEVTVFKSHKALIHGVLKYFIQWMKPRCVFGLSATPIQKSLEDIHAVMDVLTPGLLGTLKEFNDAFITRKEMMFGDKIINKIVSYKNEQALASIVEPYYIRREKTEVGYENKHVFKARYVEMLPEQAKRYAELDSMVTEALGCADLMKRLTMMEKVVDSLWLIDEPKKRRESAKLEDLEILLSGDLKKEKVVIFSKNLGMLEQAEEDVLKPLRIKYIRYTGKETNIEKREAGRQKFQNDPSIRVALVTTAAEMGYDFHAASYMIFLNHVYNPARVNQIIGRIDRPLVQMHPFTCSIHYVTANTFEEKLIPKLYREAELSKKVLGATNYMEELNNNVLEEMTQQQLFGFMKVGRAA